MENDAIGDHPSNSGASTLNKTTVPPATPSTTTSNNALSSAARLNPNPDRASSATLPKTGVVQPKPQALPKRSGPASIIVSPRQKGNPVLNHIKGIPWEYGDTPADYILGLTTCALFLSLKYHKLHPEYIYNRIKGLQGRYKLRLVLVMVDVQNHEDSLRELSKTSLINNVTLVLCWSAAEGGRYLELFKTYEHAAPTSIRQHQSSAYSDRMVDFITTPRSVNKTDAVSLVSQFGTVRTAVNARHEEVAGIAGWGEKKVKQWCGAVREPFRIQRAARRGLSRGVTRADTESPGAEIGSGERTGLASSLAADTDDMPKSRLSSTVTMSYDDHEEQAGSPAASLATGSTRPESAAEPTAELSKNESRKRKPVDESLNDGVMAALSKLRKEGG